LLSVAFVARSELVAQICVSGFFSKWWFKGAGLGDADGVGRWL
jgi:hypothetical protein